MRKFSLLLFAASMISFSGFAQDEDNSSYTDQHSTWSVGLDVGLNHFYGDLTGFYVGSNLDGNNLGFGASLYLNKYVNHLIGFSGSLGFNSLTGKNVNTYFTANEYHMALDMQFNVSSLINKGAYDESKWSWIPFAGAGLSSSLPNVYDANDVIVGSERTERHNEVMARGGLLLKYRLSNALDLDFRYMGTYMLVSDWADNVFSGKANDGHNHVRIGLTYNFGATADRHSIVYARPINDLATTVNKLSDDVAGLTGDDDNDGVSNFFDQDNETPEGQSVDGSGRALDIDGDGVADAVDQDPFTPRGARVDATGREMDDDGDGVPNSRDIEPDTEEGAMVNFQGRTIEGGMGGDMLNAFMPDVYFSFNNARVSSANEQRLVTIVKMMQANADLTLDVVGHTDPVGSESYNMNLAQRRAKAVVDVLVNTYGIDAGRLNVVAAGESAQLGNNNSINRRVEFKVAE